MLEKGKRYRIPHGAIVEVLHVNPCRALVRPVGKVHREFEDRGTGLLVAFDAPASAFSIAATSVIEEV